MVVKEKFHKNDTINHPLLSKAVQTALDNTNSFACMAKGLGYRVLDVTKTFYVDVLILDNDTYVVSYPDKITSKPCTIEDNFGCIIDFNLKKEETKMVQLTRKQINEMGTMTMRKTIIGLGYDTIDVKNNTEGKNTTEKYRKFLLSLIELEADVQKDTQEQVENHEIMHGEVVTMEDMDIEYEAREEYIAPADYEVATPAPVVVPAAPKKKLPSIDKFWNENIATKVLNNIMMKAKKNKCINFISHHMATSAMCEILCGRPLKDPITRQDNTFTDDEKNLVAEFREKFSEKYLIPNGRGTGYNIKAVGMVWYYKKVIYRYHDKIKSRNIDYIVNFKTKTITRIDDNNKVTALDSKAFEILDSTCVFIKVCN